MTFADRFGFEESSEEPLHAVDVVPGPYPPEDPPVKPGDWVVLRFSGAELDVDVTRVDSEFAGVVRNIPPDLSARLDGLKVREEISFRFEHIFVVHH